MANRLNKNIKGKYIITNEIFGKIPYLYLCKEGSGCYNETMDTSIIGELYNPDGTIETSRSIRGYWIKRLATQEEIESKKIESFYSNQLTIQQIDKIRFLWKEIIIHKLFENDRKKYNEAIKEINNFI